MLRRNGTAMLLERATGGRDLVRMAEGGEDDEATRIICDAADRIHAASDAVLGSDDPPELVDLPTWFRRLFSEADRLGPFHRRGADAAEALLDDPRDPVVLHGDLHHGNVLDFGERGWLAIDPKGLLGEAASTTATCCATRRMSTRSSPAGSSGSSAWWCRRPASSPRASATGRGVVRPVVDVVRPRRRPAARRSPPPRSASGPWRWRLR